jgi:hypothetical protein
MDPKEPRKRDPKKTDDRVDSAPKDTPSKDPVSFIEPARKNPNDTPLDKDRETSR